MTSTEDSSELESKQNIVKDREVDGSVTASSAGSTSFAISVPRPIIKKFTYSGFSAENTTTTVVVKRRKKQDTLDNSAI